VSTARAPSRVAVVACLLLTMGAGLLVHLRGGMLGATAQDIAGDALWGMMMAWWMALLLPSGDLPVRAALAYGICVAVETSQLVHTPWLDALRTTTLGHLVLGSAFDGRDLVAYALGVGLAVLVERLLLVDATTMGARGQK
jgi:hypothetical protein